MDDEGSHGKGLYIEVRFFFNGLRQGHMVRGYALSIYFDFGSVMAPGRPKVEFLLHDKEAGL
jgi:hypothetical protein